VEFDGACDGLQSWLKTTGGKGLHLWVPIAPAWDYETAKDFSEAVVQHMARTIPQRFVAKSGPRNRVGRVFIDYLRNGWVQSTAEAFSARARPGLGVSMPIAWDELPRVQAGDHWNISTAIDRLAGLRADPWAAYWTSAQDLGPAMERLGFAPADPKPARRRPVPRRKAAA
jgi:bifunctional non-homologous end joining protein LigD